MRRRRCNRINAHIYIYILYDLIRGAAIAVYKLCIRSFQFVIVMYYFTFAATEKETNSAAAINEEKIKTSSPTENENVAGMETSENNSSCSSVPVSQDTKGKQR